MHLYWHEGTHFQIFFPSNHYLRCLPSWWMQKRNDFVRYMYVLRISWLYTCRHIRSAQINTPSLASLVHKKISKNHYFVHKLKCHTGKHTPLCMHIIMCLLSHTACDFFMFRIHPTALHALRPSNGCIIINERHYTNKQLNTLLPWPHRVYE